jgi:MFS superfamily sulfate permease-like transporter
MVGVLVLGPLYGLLVAIGLAVLGLVYRSSRVETDVMGKVPGEKAAWGSLTEHPERRTYDGILVLRLDVPLFWANASEIHDRVLGTVEAHPGTRVVLLDLEATSQLDTTSIDMLELILTRLREREIDLYLVRVFYRARLTLAKAGFIEQLGEDRMWHSISAGVRAARAANHLTGKSHTQDGPLPGGPDSDEDFEHPVEPADERIVVDRDVSDPTPEAIDQMAPRGGYQDPERLGRRTKSRYPRP